MAVYRTIHLSFWTDSKVDDEFTPEDKYFFLYLLTNPHTNICGCYELGERQCCRETGYNAETISRLIKRFQEVHDVIRYDKKTKEVLILNWHKYNWTSSDKLLKNVEEVASHIKSDQFRKYVLSLIGSQDDTVSIPYPYPMDTSVTVTDTVSVTNTVKQVDELEEKFGYNEYLLETVRDWLAYKKERRETYKPVGLKTLLTTIQNNISKYGEDAVIELIRESMSSNYQGITWVKLKQNGKTGKKNISFADFM